MRRNQATVTKEANLEDKTEQKFHRLIVIFIIIHVLLVCWRSNQLAAKKGLKFCELALARRTEKKFDFSECDMLWRPAVGRRGGAFSPSPAFLANPFPSSLFLFVLSPLFGYRHILIWKKISIWPCWNKERLTDLFALNTPQTRVQLWNCWIMQFLLIACYWSILYMVG